MSTPYTPVATYHNLINVTVDGDLANSGEFNTPYQQCADNAAFCKGVLDPLISGGTISPAGPVTIATELIVDAFECTGDSTFLGNIDNTSGHLLTGTFTCTGNASVTGTLHSGGAITGLSLTVDDDIQTTTGSLATAGASIDSTGNLSASGNLSISGTTNLGGSVIAPINFAATGRSRMRSVRGTDVAAVTYAAYFNLIFWPNLATTARTATIDAGGGQGDWMFVSIDATSNALTVNFPGGATVTFASSVNPQTALFAYIGTQWFGPLFKA